MEIQKERSNVVQMRPRYALFNPELRTRMEAGVQKHTDKPVEVVSEVENVLCSYLVEAGRRLAANFATKLGEKLGRIGMPDEEEEEEGEE